MGSRRLLLISLFLVKFKLSPALLSSSINNKVCSRTTSSRLMFEKSPCLEFPKRNPPYIGSSRFQGRDKNRNLLRYLQGWALSVSASDPLLDLPPTPTPAKPKRNNWGNNRVPWTIADLFSSNPTSAVLYHAMSTPCQILALFGAIFGPVLMASDYASAPAPPVAAAGMSSLYGGSGGMVLGLLLVGAVALLGERANPPWTPEGIADRADRLAVNFPVRTLDLGATIGFLIGGLACAAFGGELTVPSILGLTDGPLGVVQAISLSLTFGVLMSALVLDYVHETEKTISTKRPSWFSALERMFS